MKLDGIVVDGSEEKEKVRELVAGLRLLRAYGKLAERALRDIRNGKDLSATLPLVERRGNSSNGQYELSTVPVHSSVSVPVLPDYSTLGLKIERMKDDNGVLDKGYLVYLVAEATVALAVLPHGHVRPVAFGQGVSDGIVGSVRPTKGGCAWSFSSSNTKRTQTAVREALARSCSRILVKLAASGHGGLGYSKAKQVHETLRLRAEAKLLLDGYAERFRRDVEASVTVDAVHAL
jgi:hypothetical protein